MHDEVRGATMGISISCMLVISRSGKNYTKIREEPPLGLMLKRYTEKKKGTEIAPLGELFACL